MGLDMFLTKEIYVGAEYSHRNIKGTVFIMKGEEQIPINFKNISTIQERAMYWRKANHIHKWFVDNVQNGVDDCKEYEVSVKQLKELIKLCERVVKDNSKAEELLPTQSGFFFGGTSYDDYYFMDTKDTIKGLKKAIKGVPENSYEVSFKYQSSW